MKLKFILPVLALIIISTGNLFAQKNLQWGKKIDPKQKCGLYRTYDDLKNDKIEEIGTITNTQLKWFMVGQKFYMFKGADFIGYRDDYGNRVKIINGIGYIILSYGKINLYSKFYGYNTKDDLGNVERNPVGYENAEMFYSFTEFDEPIKLKGWDSKHNVKIADLFFKDNETVKNAYINDESDDYDYSVKNAFSDNFERLIHYVDIYNGLVK